ncbi:type II toxin-antitoxin system mRNA interferase toxin, RelE/StbE family [Candidatus Peregrinibacteria bacterium]|nr:type II toxin-antitoxin system mRNA interferase toxin, RelE/StbE family [Candidatus Peregrinibacteria bacterium]MBI3816686.1 type II toxin-antitoxin system mRNA interferase toxin, RelE/StbE family [Candidatus Peregrinibacteria bacterium]
MQIRKRAGRQDVVSSAKEVSLLLAVLNAPARFVLREEWRDHALKGNMQGIRELHLGYDELLLYAIDEERKEVHLLEVVNHEQLRKKK